MAGPAWPPQSRQAGSRALPHGTTGRFTDGLASPSSHAHSVRAPWPLSDPAPLGVHKNPVCTKGASGSGPNSATVTLPGPAHLHVTKTVLAWRPMVTLLCVIYLPVLSTLSCS